MRNTTHLALSALVLCVAATTFARQSHASALPGSWVLADTALLREAKIPVVDSDPSTGVSLAEITPLEEVLLRDLAHEHGKCGGFELVAIEEWMGDFREQGRGALLRLATSQRMMEATPLSRFPPVVQKPGIVDALRQVREENLRETVTFLSSFATRYHKGQTPNAHVEAFKQKIEDLLAEARFPTQIGLIAHRYTPQSSIRVRIPGKSRAGEIVVIGAHLDSINQGFMSTEAPGADDNASGSSNVLEALRILVTTQAQPERTIEFFWYAGEEGGLIGSSEIAKTYARDRKNVVAALQLDMTLFPGDGEFVLGSMTDFTHPALRAWLGELNQAYLGARIIEDKCGYGCSDHASWHSNGYPALMPFEASFDRMFPDLHTPNDVVSDRMSFRHSAMFARLALAFAMELGGY